MLLATGLCAYNASSPVLVPGSSSAARPRDLLVVAIMLMLALLLWCGRESRPPFA